MKQRLSEALILFGVATCAVAPAKSPADTAPTSPHPEASPAVALAAATPDSQTAPSGPVASPLPSATPVPASRPPPRSPVIPLTSKGQAPTSDALRAQAPTNAPPAQMPDDDLLAAGDAAFGRGDLDAAQASYAEARSVAPKSAGGLVGLARVAIARATASADYASAKGNAIVVRACAQLSSAIKVAPRFGPAYVELGRGRLLLGDAQGALDALSRAARLVPDEPEAHSELGVAWLATGQSEKAVVELERAVQLDPGSAARHGNLGTALLMVGRTKEAVAEYEVRVEMDDTDAKAHSDLGTALLATTDLERASSELRRAVDLEPQRATFHSNLGYALQQAGHFDAAIDEYHEALRLDGNLVSGWINLATVLARDPARRPEARRALEHAKAIAPDDPRVKANLDELDAMSHHSGR